MNYSLLKRFSLTSVGDYSFYCPSLSNFNLIILFDTSLDFSPNFGKTSFCVLLEHGAVFKTLFIPVLVFLRHILGYPTVTKSTTSYCSFVS